MLESTHIVAVQRREHTELEALLRRYEHATVAHKLTLYARILDLVTTHAFAEETVLFPAARQHLGPGGDTLTADIERKHQRINELLARMEQSAPGDPAFELQAREAFSLLRSDAREEEEVLLVALAEKLDQARMRALGKAWLVVRRTAPNRPHPRIPRRPPGNLLAGLYLTLSDRLHRRFARHPHT